MYEAPVLGLAAWFCARKCGRLSVRVKPFWRLGGAARNQRRSGSRLEGREGDFGAIPTGENDHLVGMVTDRDIACKGLARDGFDADRTMARDVMTPGIHCCSEDDDLAKAVQHME